VVIAGTGDPGLMSKLEAAAEKSRGNAVYVKEASESLVHRIFAGADIVLVPSRFEPCGLVQLYAQRYGALPVARATGGLVDTIVDCDAKLETGTGFLFDGETIDAFYGATQRALAAYTSDRWGALRRRVMRLDRGWERAARQYEQTYKSARTT
jgi:starch synthase